MKKVLTAAVLLFLILGSAVAQNKPPTPNAPVAVVAPSDTGAIKSQNILDVKPDASAEPGYATQSNGERAKVQPGNNAPMWRQVGSGVTGYSSLPVSQAPEAGNLIQPFVQYPGFRLTNAGEAWRQVRNNWIIPYGGALLLIVVGAIALFYWRKGSLALHGAETGRQIERFTPFERSAHWANAIAFSILAISGLVMAFGKFFLHPVIGSTLFGWLTYVLKNAHNFAGPLFAVSLLVVMGTFVKDNLPRKEDFTWLVHGGGMLSDHGVASHRFNAGEKLLFWGGVLFLGLIVVGSGLVLDKLLPGLIYERGTMQLAHMIHAVATVLMMAMFLGHIYMGTIGMHGAYKAMKTGYVDETWAKEHHDLWYQDIQAGKIPAQRSQKPVSSQPVQV
ncbi:MAG: formate dehydrogenase subunit gamma [Rhodoferax sp.]|uniref:formate dehydrogenase subunit gamma n=1 Tax=Rhodoferax sp. TaxID=50421 RepID=UPI00184E92DF|nr:formate dehydrogenase subunit gamma [Rhodoferax sp.]NMM12142.1 formate dehydrogenase subunit gamma [Rhodoferax sp.]NMM20099.1 formate dehydrogenase subunit gamma [Rhodoferax sp.]